MAKAETKQEKIMSISARDLGIKIEPPKRGAAIAFSQWIRSLMQNWRQGTVGVRERSDVSKSGKKPFKQKGTGRARAGTARSPLWRGGGVTFGPQGRIRCLKVSRGIRKAALKALLNDYLSREKVLLADCSISGERPSTALVFSWLKQADLANKKVLMFLPMEDIVSYASFRNLPNVQVIFFDQSDAFTLAKSDVWLFFKRDFNQFKEMVLRWT